ncbi:integrase core domain-containing protein, partial [Thioalkalivibrio sp. AKL12]|uniref:integrase core domain-containing protein n=1 Tax=Thioalkalivibrio sp. AKL12 TaxID=1158159 RepID=UPI000476FBF5
GIQHRLTQPRKPQTNGMVERFNGRIADLLRTYHIDSSEQMQDALYHYLYLYNHAIQQKALGHRTPVAALKAWQQTHPDCFRKRVYNQPRPDRYFFARAKKYLAVRSRESAWQAVDRSHRKHRTMNHGQPQQGRRPVEST